VLLERQFRYPLARTFIEIPAGKLEPGEDPLVTGKRELLEETGYVAAEWRKLGLIHNAIGYSDEVIEIWLARGLEMRQQALAEGEFLEVFSVPLAEAQAMARDGRITDVKTVVGLLWVR
jgi:ADP-ribose pyrophosphatase